MQPQKHLVVMKYVAIILPFAVFFGIGLIAGGIANYFIANGIKVNFEGAWVWPAVFISIGVSHVLGVIYTNARREAKNPEGLILLEMCSVLIAILGFVLSFAGVKFAAAEGLTLIMLGCSISLGLCIWCVLYPKRIVRPSVGVWICIGVTGAYILIYLIANLQSR